MAFRSRYQEEVTVISQGIELIKRIDRLNTTLREYDWIFMHPYNQGFEITALERLVGEVTDDLEEKILNIYARKFLDLKLTISIIDGYYRKRPFLRDFVPQIEESVILCLQKDFAGAICLVIPAIEGTIRNYLISKKGESVRYMVSMKDLTTAFYYLEQDYVSRREKTLRENNNLPQSLDENQIKQILKKEREYFSLWIKQLNDYLKFNLYRDTRNRTGTDIMFNRHNIFHGFDKTDYNFKNYLKLINCINFLNWAIGLTHPGCSILIDVDEKEIRKKWLEFYKILIMSEVMTETKSIILGREIESFKPYLDKTLLKSLSLSEIFHKQILSAVNIFGKK